MILQPLPCPFCGGEPHVTEALNEVWVRCSQCKSANGLSTADEARAIAAWNRRAIPTGYVLVPEEPTDEMVDAAWESDAVDYIGEHKRIVSATDAYKAMLAAAKEK